MTNGAVVNQNAHQREGGLVYRNVLCGVAHPSNPNPNTCHPDDEFHFCRRLPHRDGSDHSAFTFKISEPEYWPDLRPTELDGDDYGYA